MPSVVNPLRVPPGFALLETDLSVGGSHSRLPVQSKGLKATRAPVPSGPPKIARQFTGGDPPTNTPGRVP